MDILFVVSATYSATAASTTGLRDESNPASSSSSFETQTGFEPQLVEFFQKLLVKIPTIVDIKHVRPSANRRLAEMEQSDRKLPLGLLKIDNAYTEIISWIDADMVKATVHALQHHHEPVSNSSAVSRDAV